MDELCAFKIQIAGLCVEVTSKSNCLKEFCDDFVVDSDSVPMIKAQASDEEIEAEMKLYKSPLSAQYCESACVYRAIAEKLPEFDRLVFHGAAVSVKGRGYIFTAPPGTGKSTHISLWKRVFGDMVTVINGDKPILRSESDTFYVCSSPWAGKEGWKTNISVPLEGICLLKRGEKNKIKKVCPSEHFQEIIKQVYTPKDGNTMLKTLELADKLAEQVPFYLLECNISDDAAKTSFNAMVFDD